MSKPSVGALFEHIIGNYMAGYIVSLGRKFKWRKLKMRRGESES